MHLITCGSCHAQEIANLQKTKVNAIKITKVRADGINFVLGKNGDYIPISLGGRSFIVVRQADKNLAVSKNFKILQLYFKSTFRLFEWIYGASSLLFVINLLFVTGPAKINNVSAKNDRFFRLCSIITYELFIQTQ